MLAISGLHENTGRWCRRGALAGIADAIYVAEKIDAQTAEPVSVLHRSNAPRVVKNSVQSATKVETTLSDSVAEVISGAS